MTIRHRIYIKSEIKGAGRTFHPFIRKSIRIVLKEEEVGAACQINVLLTDDKGIRRLNSEYRNLDKPTDVLSFPMLNCCRGKIPETEAGDFDMDTKALMLGDMAISVETAKKQAADIGHSAEREISYLTVHSVLHLLGYDHIDNGEERKAMRDREKIIMKELRIR